MPTNIILGEFEQLVLLAILRLENEAYALPLRSSLSKVARRPVGRGALYRTLDRLAEKGLLEWHIEEEAPRRGGLPRRRFIVTRPGIVALRQARRTLLALWDDVGEVLR